MVLKWCGAQCFIHTHDGAPDATGVGEKYNYGIMGGGGALG